jgi:hypothetical protein
MAFYLRSFQTSRGLIKFPDIRIIRQKEGEALPFVAKGKLRATRQGEKLAAETKIDDAMCHRKSGIESPPPKQHLLPNDIVIFVFTTSKFQKTRLSWMEQTWATKFPLIFYLTDGILAGFERPKLLVPVACPGYWPNGSCTDTASHLYKANQGADQVWKQNQAVRQAQWFVVVGDDNYISVDNLLALLQPHTQAEPLVLGQKSPGLLSIRAATTSPAKALHAFAGGGGIILNSAAMGQFLNNKVIYQDLGFPAWSKVRARDPGGLLWLHDIYVTVCIADMGIEGRHVDGLYSQPPNFYFTEGRVKPIRSPAIFHYVKDLESMKYLQFLLDELPKEAANNRSIHRRMEALHGVLNNVCRGCHFCGECIEYHYNLTAKRVCAGLGRRCPNTYALQLRDIRIIRQIEKSVDRKQTGPSLEVGR